MKKIITLLTGLVFVFSGIYLYRFVNKPTVNQSVKMIIVSQAVSNKNFVSYRIKEGKTAFDLLKQSAKVIAKGEGTNAYVTSINGKEAQSANREYWAFYTNGKLAEVGAGSYKLKAGDKIEWKIEIY